MCEQELRLTVVFERSAGGGYSCHFEELPKAFSEGETLEEAKAALLSALAEPTKDPRGEVGKTAVCEEPQPAASIAKTPKPPYYAVIFTSLRAGGDRGYGHMAERMVKLAAQQRGFLGIESARTPDGPGITVSYWSSAKEIAAWKAHAEHRVAQQMGQQVWYSDYHLRVARVERDYGKCTAAKKA